MRSSIVLALTGLAMLTTATPISPPVPHALPLPRPHYPRQENANDTAPCARVSQAIYPSGSGSPTTNIIPAKLAYDCIVSVPLNVQAAKALVRALPAYIQWQSTLDALKNPPAEYVEKVQPPTDIMGGLKLIEEDLDASKYENEYDFGWSLYTLIVSAHDGHFAYIPDSVGSVFTWGRDVPLVSVSEDGKKLPSVFAFHDVLGSQFKNISYTPSAITEINGQDVFEYLENFSQYGSLQDRDALYNNMFYELAHVSLGSSGSGTGMFTGGGRARFAYPGDTTTFTFANGTSLTIENFARVMTSFRDIYSGEDLRDQVFYFGPTSTPSVMTTKLEVEKPVVQVAADEAAPAAAPRTPPGYPQPVIAGAGNVINAFYIDAPGYEDVAVLQVPNFVASLAYEVSFQKVTQEFIPTALAAGKTKMIIDVQANGGGTILQGYDMFKQFFPNIEPNATNRFRAIEDIDLIGQAFSSWASQFPRVETTNSTILRAQSSYFDYHTDMKVDGTNFESWDEKFGPVEMNGALYTTPHRWNLSDVHIDYNSGGINITGYGPLSNVSRVPPFKAENIVILTDGYCASTCTIFSELMTKQAGVKTIALGGRSNSEPIQAIGGVKGTNNFGWNYIDTLAELALSYAEGDLKQKLNETIAKTYANPIPAYRTGYGSGVNNRDGLMHNDDSGVALQFIYEEADCRLYYTPEMTVDITAVWKAAADAQWRDSGKCVGQSGYGKKREATEVTKSLKRRRLAMSQAAAQERYQALESTFGLETKCNLRADGFMQP